MTPNTDRPSNSGLSVTWSNNTQIAIEDLPNWEHALAHLRSDPRLDETWAKCADRTAMYYDARATTAEKLITRLSEMVRAEYGPEMKIGGSFQWDSPPWCDVPLLAWFRMARAANPGWAAGPFYLPDNNQFYVTLASMRPLWGRNAYEADPSRLQRIWDVILADSKLTALVDDVVSKHKAAVESVSILTQQSRQYSNVLGMTQEFEGECEECSRRWKPR